MSKVRKPGVEATQCDFSSKSLDAIQDIVLPKIFPRWFGLATLSLRCDLGTFVPHTFP